MVLLINIATAVFAILAALFWFCSARVELPQIIQMYSTPNMIPDHESIKHGLYGNTFSPELQDMVRGLRLQSELSQYAAIYAGLAAISPVASALLSGSMASRVFWYVGIVLLVVIGVVIVATAKGVFSLLCDQLLELSGLVIAFIGRTLGIRLKRSDRTPSD